MTEARYQCRGWWHPEAVGGPVAPSCPQNEDVTEEEAQSGATSA